MILGFIGTGHIAAAMAAGLCTAPNPPRIVVGPRNAETAAGLAKRFKQVTVARDNQTVVDSSDWVVLAIRPQAAKEVVTGLKFKPGQTVLSLIAPVADEWIDAAVKPGVLRARIFLMPPCEMHIGPTMVFPRDAAVEALMQPLGTVIPVKDRREFLALWTLTALLAPFYGFAASSADWAAANGAGANAARAFAISTFHALAAIGAKPDAEPLLDLAKHAQTPGGLNEQVVRELTAKGWFDAIAPALDGILKRLEGRMAKHNMEQYDGPSSTAAHDTFDSAINSLAPSFGRLLQMSPVRADCLPKKMPKQGVYLFSENERHLYVGRSNGLKARYGRHCNPGATHRMAAFAFRLAREETGRIKASYKADEHSRNGLMRDPIFKAAFDQAKSRIRNMQYRFVEETNQTRQALLEIYCAVVLKTPYNDFETH